MVFTVKGIHLLVNLAFGLNKLDNLAVDLNNHLFFFFSSFALQMLSFVAFSGQLFSCSNYGFPDLIILHETVPEKENIFFLIVLTKS